MTIKDVTDLHKALVSSGQSSTLEEAHLLVIEMRQRVYLDSEDPEDVLHEYGLEPDYVPDLLFHS